MKKIVFLLNDLNGAGGERVMLNLANALAEEGAPVDLILLEKKGAFLKEVSASVTVVSFGARRIIGALVPLVRYLRRERPGSVIATSIHTQVLLMLARTFSLVRVRTVLRIGIPLSTRFKTLRSPRDKVVAFLARLLFPRATYLVPNSFGIANDSAHALGIPLEKFTVIYNPVAMDVVRKNADTPLDHAWLTKEREVPVIVAAGRLRPQKDFPTLIRALAASRMTPRLILLGAGSDLEDLKRLAREVGVGPRVDFMGFVANPYAYMARADVFVLPSLFEGFPNALLEAMASGTAVIATDCKSGPRELLAPQSDPHAHASLDIERAAYGVLVPARDVGVLQKAIDLVLGDESVKGEYRKKSIERARDFAMEMILPAYKKILCVE